MTMCELKTASHNSLPMECELFVAPSDFAGGTAHKGCVECVYVFICILLVYADVSMWYRALSRSAQYWSSYSGYLREVRE